jgi:hypothetical protein
MNAQGRINRDLSIDTVEVNNELAASVLFDIAVYVARKMPTFTSDDVWSAANVKVREPRVMGAVMRRMRVDGWAEPLDTTSQGYRPVNHARPQRVWRSLVYRGAAA